MIANRKYIIQGIFLLVGIVFLIQLFAIQVVDKSYRAAAEQNIVQEVIEYPYRGLLLDRNGEIMVYNEPQFDLMVTPNHVFALDTLGFCQLLDITRSEFDKKLAEAKAYSYVKPSIFYKQISNTEFARIEGKLDQYKGFVIQPRIVRAYSYPAMANALGYISEISKNELGQDTANYYHQGDYIGKSGLESFYESSLRGKRGKKFKIRNVQGIDQGSFNSGKSDTLAIPGQTLTSTIDLDLQLYGEKLMAGKAGSVIAIEPSTGEILAIISAPTYDPGALSGRNFSENFDIISQDTLKPLFNRPLMASYRPGSIFKIVQALVALQEGVIYPSTRLKCNTALLGCHNGSSHPFGTSENLVGAITNSCNPYFFQVMRMMVMQGEVEDPYQDSHIGLDKWRSYIDNFGFGNTLGIDLPGENSGMIPNSAYYDRAYSGRPWKFSNIYSLAIGEGENLVVPLQMANFVATVANRGHYYTPHIIKEVNNDGEPLPQYLVRHETEINPEYFEIAVEAMAEVVRSGTGQYRAKLPDIEVCGKTGTVQNDPNPDHSVFIAFAPKINPKIAISVYVEDAGQGARAGAGIAGLMIEKYLKGDSAVLRMEPYILKGDFLY